MPKEKHIAVIGEHSKFALWAIVLSALFITNVQVAYASRFAAFDLKYSSGKFGGDITDTVSALEFSSGIITPQYDAEFIVPYIQRDLNDDTFDTSDSGIGDIVVRGGYKLLEDGKQNLSVYGSLAAKFATADEDKGLGTGENDLGIFFSLEKKLPDYSVSLFTGYRINGDPPGVELEDVFSYGVGLSKTFTKNSAYVALAGQQAVSSGLDDPLEIQAGIYHILNTQYLLRGELSAGLSDGSPDQGLSIGIVRLF